MATELETVLSQMKAVADPAYKKKMAHFGINADKALGLRLPQLREIAKNYKKDHSLAMELWETGIHEAQLLAAFVADAQQFTEAQVELWVSQFDSWDVCDMCCFTMDKMHNAYEKALEWAEREPEFEKRAGFAMMASLAVHDKNAPDQNLEPFFPIIEKQAWDNRNFVKKAVNWALRQIGKKNLTLHAQAIECAERILQQPHKSAHWIARDALRELRDPKVLKRLEAKSKRTPK